MQSNILSKLGPNYYYAPIVYHDTWISVDPIIGCHASCKYCFLRIANWNSVSPEKVYSVHEVVEMLLKHRLFVPNKTVISFGNQTDPFHPLNIEHLMEFLILLDEHNLQNAVVLITKQAIPDEFLDMVVNLKCIRVIFCISYSCLNPVIERGINHKEILLNFQKVAKRKLPLLHFFRPIVESNSNVDILRETLNYVSKYAIATVYNGLKLHPFLNRIYYKEPLLKPIDKKLSDYGEYLPLTIQNRLLQIARELPDTFPLYRHASCAVSLALQIPDYNATVYRHSICKEISICPDWKRRLCSLSQRKPDDSIITSLLSNLNKQVEWRLTDNCLEIYGVFDQEEFAYILHSVNFPVKVKQLKYNRPFRGSIFQNCELNQS